MVSLCIIAILVICNIIEICIAFHFKSLCKQSNDYDYNSLRKEAEHLVQERFSNARYGFEQYNG
jgi:hypothetical protein